ncbi:TPA: hypothetical protein WI804_002288 [Neisseria meningitidis]
MSLSAENRTFYLVETGEIGFDSLALFISQSLEEAEAVVADFFKRDEKLHYEMDGNQPEISLGMGEPQETEEYIPFLPREPFFWTKGGSGMMGTEYVTIRKTINGYLEGARIFRLIKSQQD